MGQAQRDKDANEHHQRVGAIYDGSFLQCFGQAFEEVHQDDHAEHGDRAGQHKRPQRIHQVQALHQYEQRDQAAAEKHCEHDDPHVDIAHAEGPRVPGKRESRQDDQEHVHGGAQQHALDGNPERSEKLALLDDVLVGRRVEVDGPEGHLADAGAGPVRKGDGQRVQQGRQADERHEHEDQDNDDVVCADSSSHVVLLRRCGNRRTGRPGSRTRLSARS